LNAKGAKEGAKGAEVGADHIPPGLKPLRFGITLMDGLKPVPFKTIPRFKAPAEAVPFRSIGSGYEPPVLRGNGGGGDPGAARRL